MNFRIHPEAKMDLDASTTWYELQTPGSGEALFHAVLHGFDEIEESPEAWAWWPQTRLNPPVRRYVVRDFPYVIPYAIFGDWITVLAVAHAKRRPGYWMRRHQSL